MTSDERAQLVEDIKSSNNLRHGIVERAQLDEGFDILAAWEEVEKLDRSKNERVIAARACVVDRRLKRRCEPRFRHSACVRRSMENQDPPRDSDPSEMTDFEKNATQEELKKVVPDPQLNRQRQERG